MISEERLGLLENQLPAGTYQRPGAECCPGTPTDPGAPAPDSRKVTPLLGGDACIFWNGGTLSSTTYTQKAISSGGSRGNSWAYTCTYTYDVGGDVVAERTAWTLQQVTGSADVSADLTGFVAGQSVVSKKTGSPWTLKYSHTMVQSDGVTLRLLGLQYVLDGGTPVDLMPTTLFYTGVDFNYFSNAFESTNSQFLAQDGALVSAVQLGYPVGDRETTPRYDDFAGNDFTNGDQVTFGPSTLTLAAGSHTLVISGTVKDNFGSRTLSPSVTLNITVHAESCSP